jgi:hypothetical protein
MNPFTNLFLNDPWFGVGIWVLVYVSDYSLTLTCARLYQGGVKEKIAFEGSYEITPYFQGDIDSLRKLSPRFVAALVWSAGLLALIWWVSVQSQPQLYRFVFGAMILSQAAIHIRHIRNLLLFRAIVSSCAVRGRIEYSRPLILRMSSVELLSFAGLFLLLFVLTQEWFILGGAVSCLVTALKHFRLARKAVSAAPSEVPA